MWNLKHCLWFLSNLRRQPRHHHHHRSSENPHTGPDFYLLIKQQYVRVWVEYVKVIQRDFTSAKITLMRRDPFDCSIIVGWVCGVLELDDVINTISPQVHVVAEKFN